MSECAKCLTRIPDEYYVSYAMPCETGMKHVRLCLNCNNVFDNRRFLLEEFLKDDYGKFPIGRIEQDMIEARKRRSKGDGWK